MDDEIPSQGGFHVSSSHEASLELIIQRRENFGQTQCVYSFSFKTEHARSASGPKLQGTRAEDAKAKPYFELTILVT